MARIRSIKPGFFKSEDVSVLPLRARLTWIGLWTHCDDSGRAKDNVRLIKGEVWPLDEVSLRDIEEDLATLAAHGRIVRYEVDGQRFLEVTNWSEHQKINRPTTSRLPAPPVHSDRPHIHNVSPHAPLTEGSPQEGSKEGKGRGASSGGVTHDSVSLEPPLKCDKHTHTPNPPACGKCADARRTHQQWDAERRARVASAPRCTRHPDQLAAHCATCRSERLAPT